MADRDDADFMSGMKKLLGMDKEKVDDLLSRIDADDLLDLQDAISRNDKKAARRVIKAASVDEEDEPDINALFRRDDPEDDEDIGADKLRRHDSDDEMVFQVGDAVEVGDHGIEGTVAKPDAPNNTVGVKIKGRLRMVDRKDVKLKEGVLSMTRMPGLNLSRIRELAGIAGTLVTADQMPAVTVQEIPAEDDAWNSQPEVVEESCAGQCMAALDMLEQNLPGVTLAELKDIRARIYAVTQTMNESVDFGRRRKK